jgi:NADH-ubiquinone oxidoreductase chain 5
MCVPLIVLGFGSIFMGYLFKDAFIGLGSDFFQNSIFIRGGNMNLLESEFLEPLTK